MDLFEALYTTRAMRRVRPDPVPEEVVAAMLDAAIRAPSGSNAQSWRWVTVTDRPTLEAIADLYRAAWQTLNDTVYKDAVPADTQALRVSRSAAWLADNFETVPLVVLPFTRNDPNGASIYPAVWNLMLAARGHGVGTTLTTILGVFQGAALGELLGVPADRGWVNAAAVTCGYPLGRWDVAARKPAHQVVYQDRWGRPPDWTAPEALWPGAT
ncbi:MAG: nitroreductase family protein [Acidimicrobiia bacterium]